MESVLQHHGILGQKWGIRRFQNADGSLTEAGKKRYGSKAGGRLSVGKSMSELDNQRDSIRRKLASAEKKQTEKAFKKQAALRSKYNEINRDRENLIKNAKKLGIDAVTARDDYRRAATAFVSSVSAYNIGKLTNYSKAAAADGRITAAERAEINRRSRLVTRSIGRAAYINRG